MKHWGALTRGSAGLLLRSMVREKRSRRRRPRRSSDRSGSSVSSPGRRRRSREEGAGQRRSQSARHRVESAPVRMADLSGSRARMRSRRSSGSAEMRSSSAVAAASISSPSSPARRFFELDAPRNCAIVELLAAPTPRFLLGSPPLEISTSGHRTVLVSRAGFYRAAAHSTIACCRLRVGSVRERCRGPPGPSNCRARVILGSAQH